MNKLKSINFWKRLELFVKDIQVNDLMSGEEKEMILNIAKEYQQKDIPAADRPKNVLIDVPYPSERDWKEDFNSENGNYMNVCSCCRNAFMGHKRRIICKECFPKRQNSTPISAVKKQDDPWCKPGEHERVEADEREHGFGNTHYCKKCLLWNFDDGDYETLKTKHYGITRTN